MTNLALYLTVGLFFCLGTSRAVAADLTEQTSRAYERYADDARRVFLDRVRTGAAASGRAVPPSDGEVISRPGSQDGIVAVAGGLVHHWIGVTFIGGVRLEDALKISYAYDDYDTFYTPVIASQLLSSDANRYRVLLRIKESAGGLSAVLDVTTHVEYFHPSNTSAYSISMSDEVREVKNPGSPREQRLPAGIDSGYLWRAATLNRLVEHDNGLFIEMETLGLSRSFPPLLSWIIEPIARRLGRRSVELSLQEFRSAVLGRKR
jgi:hypothetical protein